MRLVNVYALVTLCFTLNGCFKMDVVHSGTDSVRGKTSKTSLVQAVTSETGAVTAAFSAQSTTTQILSAAASETMSGTVLALPPGTLTIDTSISIEESAPIATETMGAELGINAVMQQTGTPVSVQTDVPMDAKQPFTLSMPLPVLGLTDDDKWTNLIVIYKVKLAADGLTVAGVIPRSEIVVENNVAKISVMNFGAFQTALTNVPVVEKKQVETKSEIVTKQQVVQLPPLSVTSRVPFVAKENQTVTISGSNFRPGLMLALGGKKVGDLKVLSDSKASFVAPKVESLGLTKLTAEQDGVSQSVSMFYSGTGDLPLITEVESEVCAGKKYYNANGEVKVGTKLCPTAAEMANITPANLKSGVVVMGVTGTMVASPATCASDGESNCVASASYPAVNKAAVNPAQILSGASVAGVSGTYVAPTTTPLADCTAEGEINCKTNSSFKAIAVSGLSSKMSKIRNSVTLLGMTGTLADCSADGVNGCVATNTFPAMMSSGAAAKIATGQTLGGVAGTGAVRPADCAADGAQNCVAVTNFPAMALTGAAAKIASGQMLGGVSGSLASRPADCMSDGDTGCVAVANYPAVDKNFVTTNAAKIRSSLTVGGVSGSLNDCSSDGGSGCFVLGPTYAAALLTGANAKIASGQTLAGVSGSAPARPADCSSDGAVGCVAVNGFPAADAATSAPKIISGQSVAGIAGTSSGGRPSDCALDGEEGCVSVANFPAMQLAGAAAKIASGLSLGGVSGTAAARPADCSYDGGINCVAISNFPAVDKINNLAAPKLAKIHSTITVAGIAGTMADCSTDGGLGCMAATPYVAAYISGAASKILQGQTLAGVSGSALPKPANCSIDNQTNCVAVASYPAVDKNILTEGNIKKNVTIAGVTGNYPSSFYPLTGADGGTPDLDNATFNIKIKQSAPFEYFSSDGTRQTGTGDVDIVSMNIKNGIDIFGSTGAFGMDCTSDSQVGCVTTSTFKAANTASYSEWDIRAGRTIGGKAGNLAFYKNMAKLATWNRTSGTGANASTTSADIYDTIDDYNNNSSTFPAEVPATGSWGPIPGANWLRDPLSDSDTSGTCNGAEACVYKDQITGLLWAKPDATMRSLDAAIGYCAGLNYGTYTGWRVPTQKEILQAYNDGLWSLKTPMLFAASPQYWSATTDSMATGNAFLIDISRGEGITTPKTGTELSICVK